MAGGGRDIPITLAAAVFAVTFVAARFKWRLFSAAVVAMETAPDLDTEGTEKDLCGANLAVVFGCDETTFG